MYYGSRGIVGLVKPTYRPGSMESFIKLMPEGVGFIPAHAGVRAGNEKELQEALTVAEKKVARLAELGADVVMIMGAPPTMVRGHGADRQIAESLTAKYKIPVTVATIAQVDAFRALGMKKLVGVTYFQDDMNQRFAKFLEDDGFEVKAMKGIEVPFKGRRQTGPGGDLQLRQETFLEAGKADGIYMLGAGWHNLAGDRDAREDLKTTVLSSIPAQVWATKKILNLNEPLAGYGRLLAEMPLTMSSNVQGSRFKASLIGWRWRLYCCNYDRVRRGRRTLNSREAEGHRWFYTRAFNATDTKTLTDGFQKLIPRIEASFYRGHRRAVDGADSHGIPRRKTACRCGDEHELLRPQS
jgi:maleate cis-trans isomerase